MTCSAGLSVRAVLVVLYVVAVHRGQLIILLAPSDVKCVAMVNLVVCSGLKYTMCS